MHANRRRLLTWMIFALTVAACATVYLPRAHCRARVNRLIDLYRKLHDEATASELARLLEWGGGVRG